MEENIDPQLKQTPEPTQTPKEPFNKTPILVAALVILTGILLIVSLSSKNQSSQPKLVKDLASESHTILAIENQKNDELGVSSVDVNVDTGGDKVNNVQLELTYKPSELTDVKVLPGSFFTDPTVLLNKVDEEKGTISFAVGQQLGKDGIKGIGNVAVITFSKKTPGQSQINFSPATVVTAVGSSQSVLKKTVSGVVDSAATPSQ